MKNRILDSRYKIISFLGKGGFGTTYLAEDTKRPHNPPCVVKNLNPGIDDPEFLKIARRFFIKEAETLEKLGVHDQIPRLLANFEQDQEFYLVQEYIEGQTLTLELSPNQLWPETKVIDLLCDCLKIIDFVHRNGVIHRDIKPANLIRRSQDDKLVLVDFGTVKEVIMSQTQTFASTVAVGSRGYMPTEQARGKPRFSSDLYALGVIAIQALTGIEPIHLQEDENGEIVWQSQAQCSPELREIITKMTRYHFKDRYQSASEILEQLNILDNSKKISNDLENTFIIDSQKTSKIKINTATNSISSTFSPSVNSISSTFSPPVNSISSTFSPPVKTDDRSNTTIINEHKNQKVLSFKFVTILVTSILLAVGALAGLGFLVMQSPNSEVDVCKDAPELC